jgi:hypothetical protein
MRHAFEQPKNDGEILPWGVSKFDNFLLAASRERIAMSGETRLKRNGCGSAAGTAAVIYS